MKLSEHKPPLHSNVPDERSSKPWVVEPRAPAISSDQARFLLAAIVDSSDDAIVSKDLTGTITTWNQSAQRLFGYSADEMIGQSILRLIPEELHSEEFEILNRISAGERIEHYETVRTRKDGERIEISATISPVCDAQGHVIGASKIARDITGRRRLDDSRFRLAAIVDSADDAIISKDLNGIIATWNEGARRMFGYTSEEMVGQPLLRLIPPELQYEEAEILRKLRVGEQIDHYETVRLSKTGDLVDVSVTISPIVDGQGRVIGASKIARNISDRKRIEKLLIQSEKLAVTGRMAAAIAHEINNPLESLVNLIFLARHSCAENEKALSYLVIAEGEVERISHIARQTLGYYRDTGAPSELFLHSLIENILAVYHSKMIASDIEVATTFNDLRKIVVSRGELLQVFSNIITNAIDAMKQGGKLTISMRKTRTHAGDGIQTVIRDQGSGIAQDYLDKIFEPFFTTKGSLGTGLGLWIARQLTERHGGRIDITSSTDPGNSGTTVSIYLPFVRPAHIKAAQQADQKLAL